MRPPSPDTDSTRVSSPSSATAQSDHKRRLMDYDGYLKQRRIAGFYALLRKIGLYLNAQWNFCNRCRVHCYRMMGVNIPSTAWVYIAREGLFDDNFPELITIEQGAAISWRVTLLCHTTIGPRKVVGPIHIGRKATIGTGAIVLPGITIGEFATVGAGTVVTRDVPPHGIVRGASPVYSEDKAGH